MTGSKQDLVRSWFSTSVLDRARTDTVTEDRDGVWWVDTAEGRRYRVQVTVVDGGDGEVLVTCSCANGQAVGNWPRCHHAAATMLRMLSGE